MTNVKELISVIIPYYQTESGILRKSVKSVLAQSVLATNQLQILIVDDESPVPADSEIEGISLPDSCTLRIIRQKNAGPAAARNRGLDEAVSTTEFIAFVDSDDRWTNNHLSNAITALGQDADFYFSDFYQLDQEVSAFDRAKRINLLEHQKLGEDNFLYLYKRDMVQQVITGNVIGTSTVVYRFSSAPALRFREEFFNAGEDYLFWIDFCRAQKKIVFSSLKECEYGKGVNIYSGAEWGTLALLDRISNELRYRKLSLGLPCLDVKTKQDIKKSIGNLRIQFAHQILYRVMRGKRETWFRVKRMYGIDRSAVLLLPINTLVLLVGKLKSSK
jgi:succinoglycan biosynthesis protein ExoW